MGHYFVLYVQDRNRTLAVLPGKYYKGNRSLCYCADVAYRTGKGQFCHTRINLSDITRNASVKPHGDIAANCDIRLLHWLPVRSHQCSHYLHSYITPCTLFSLSAGTLMYYHAVLGLAARRAQLSVFS